MQYFNGRSRYYVSLLIWVFPFVDSLVSLSRSWKVYESAAVFHSQPETKFYIKLVNECPSGMQLGLGHAISNRFINEGCVITMNNLRRKAFGKRVTIRRTHNFDLKKGGGGI